MLVDAGADVNAKDDTEQSAYLIATGEIGDDPRLLELTLANGADVNAKDSYNGTGLSRAAERGHAAIVRRLLETAIEVDHVNRLGGTALLEAIILGDGGDRHAEVVRLLGAVGANADLADREGVAALTHARRKGFASIVVILEGVGARSWRPNGVRWAILEAALRPRMRRAVPGQARRRFQPTRWFVTCFS